MAAVAGALITEHSYFWLGVEPTRLPEGGTVTSGEQVYVEYFVPAERRHESPIVFVHGGGGQSIAFLGPGGGRPGWLHRALARGYTVYLIDRPGYGRNPPNPAFLGDAPTPFEVMVPLFKVGAAGGRWPGTGEADDPGVAAFMAQQRPMRSDNAAQIQEVTRRRGVELLERIGPAIVITHSAGGPFGWLVADARPELVRALVSFEGIGPASLAVSLTYEPPVADVSELRLEPLPEEPDVDWGPLAGIPRMAQPSPARRLVALARVPLAVVTSDDQRFATLNRDTIAYLRAAGCTVEDLRLADLGIHGNGHMMSLEDNNAEVLDAGLDWVERRLA
jgi:pimeloyl-ACP methyl ester carboxylesterase